MKGRNALKLVIALAVVCAAGIIGMLLVEGAVETLLLALAALPLAVGLWCWWNESRGQRPASPGDRPRR